MRRSDAAIEIHAEPGTDFEQRKGVGIDFSNDSNFRGVVSRVHGHRWSSVGLGAGNGLEAE
jgi:hypothetical protein